MHLLMNHADLAHFENDDIHVCHPMVPVHKNMTCDLSLLLSDTKAVRQLCTPLYTHNPKAQFISYRGGHSWAFSLPTKGAKLLLSDNQGHPIPHNLGPLPETGVLHLGKYRMASIDGSILFAGSSLQSDAEFDGTLIIPDVPKFLPDALKVPKAEQADMMRSISSYLNESKTLGKERGVGLHTIQQMLQATWASPSVYWHRAIHSRWTRGAKILIILVLLAI